MPPTRILAWLAVAAATAPAQVAPGTAVQTFFLPGAPIESLLLVRRDGTTTPVTNLLAQGIGGLDSVALDPIDGSLWLGSITHSMTPTTPGLRHVRLSGAAAGTATFVAVLPTSPNGISGIAFDPNGNPIVTSSFVPPHNGGVFRVDRHSGALTNLLAPHPPLPVGIANCVTVDPDTGDVYFGLCSVSAGGPPARVFVLRGPFPNAAPPVLVGSCGPASGSTTISSLAFWPARGADPARVYWTTFGTQGDGVGWLPAAGGAPLATPGSTAAWPPMNGIAYDRGRDDFWVCSSGLPPDCVFRMDAAGSNALVAIYNGSGGWSPTSIAVNDRPSASLRACPQHLPAAPAPLLVEVSLAGSPGDLGAIGIDVGGSVVLVALAPFDASGVLATSSPAVLGAGAPNSFAWWGAGIAGDLSAVRFVTGPQPWPAN